MFWLECDKFCMKIKIEVFGFWLKLEGGKYKINLEYVEVVLGFIFDEVIGFVNVWEVVDKLVM